MIIATIIYILKKVLVHFPFLKAKITGIGIYALLFTIISSNVHRLHMLARKIESQVNRSTKKIKMKKNKYSLLIIMMLLVLASCKVSKDIEKPTALLPENFRNDTIQDTASISAIEWKQFFEDVKLQNLIDSAILMNNDMLLAIKNIESAQLLLKQTKWAYFPSINAQVGTSSNRPSDNSLNGLSASQFLKTTHIEDYSANINISWEADIWGKIKNQRAGVLASFLQTEAAKKTIQTNIVATIAQGYYNLLMLDEQLAIAKKNIILNDSTISIMRLQFTAGQVTSLAVQQAEAQQLTAAALVPELEQNIVLQENAISILSGILPNAITRSTLQNDAAISRNVSAGIPTVLLRSRPDIKSAELDLTIANARVGISKANMYPTLTISAAAGFNSFKASNWFNIPASLFGVVAGGIVQPVFQKKQLTTAYELAKVDREKTLIRFRQTVLYAVGEVSDALVKMEKIKTQQAIVSSQVNTLQAAIKNASLLFNTGMANYLEVITAQSNVLQSELELAALNRAQVSAKIELYRSLGGGWF
jgi:outer membrane protein, multidrug efflux system